MLIVYLPGIQQIAERSCREHGVNMSKPKIGMCTSNSKLDDSSFLFSAWTGLKRARENLDIESLVVESDDDAAVGRTLSYLSENGFDLVWAVGFNMQEPILEAAHHYPDKRFAVVDVEIPESPPNLLSVQFKEEEGAYLIGYLAARLTTSGTIGFLGGLDVPLIRKFQHGFAAGAGAARKDVDIEVAFTDSFLSYERGRLVAEELYGRGCDIVFHAAGSAGKGAIRYARDTDRYIIGCDIDQSFLAPRSVLTSMTKDVESVVYSTTEAFVRGTFNGGATVKLGVKDGVVGFAPIHHPNVPAELIEELGRLRDRIGRGELQVS